MDTHPPATGSEFSVNNAVKLKRERLGLSQRELGRRARLSEGYVSALEAGRIQPSLRAFAKLAAELRLSSLEMQVILSAECSFVGD